MNILYLAHRIPYPPNKGDKLRAFRQIEQLSLHHNVWCACFIDTADDRRYVKDLANYGHRVEAIRLSRPLALFRGMVGWCVGETITESFYRNSNMKNLLQRWSKETTFDAVVAFSSSMAPYALSVVTGRRIVDLCDLDSAKWTDYASQSHFPLKQIYSAEGCRLAKREAAFIQEFDGAILITRAEAEQLDDVDLRKRVHIVGNGVNLSNQSTPEPKNSAESQGEISAPPVVGFIGTMDYRPNIEAVEWFVHHSWPSVHRAVPRATFHIIGRKPTRRVRRLARIPGVVVVGEVENVHDELALMTVSVAPLQLARGLQNKVLEAMAAGKPVVLTKAAAEGIDARAGEHFIVNDEPDQIAQIIIDLIRDERRRSKLAAAARGFVRSHHNWAIELERFELLVIGSSTPKSSASHKDQPADFAQSHLDVLPAE